MRKLTVDLLKAEAKAFAEKESRHKEESLYGVTDGKAVGTYLEHKFQELLQRKEDEMGSWGQILMGSWGQIFILDNEYRFFKKKKVFL